MTTSHQKPYSSLDDIIFEGRNRAYGAYLLRKIYNQHLMQALFIGLSLFLLFISVPLLATYLKPAVPVGPTVIPHDPHELLPITLPNEVLEPPIAPPVQEVAPPPAAPATIEKFTSVFKLKDKVVNPTDIPDQKDLGKVDVGTAAAEGTPGGTSVLPGEGTGKISVPVPVEQPVFDYAPQMPEFPGGEAALVKYMSENIRYTPLAERNNLQGLVVLSFVVNAHGDITDIQVLKKLGGGLDEEAIRVVKTMPRWAPGRNNGTPVNVRFKLPVRFNIKN